MNNEGINFYDFTWATTLSYLFLLSIVSITMFYLVKERSFRYYFVYGVFLLIYMATKHPTLDSFFSKILPDSEEIHYASNFNWWVQIVFYTFYGLFCYYILNLQLIKPKTVHIIRRFLYGQLIISTIIFIVSLLTNKALMAPFFLYWFLPVMLGLTLYFLPIAFKAKGKLKYVILTGIVFYIGSALVALYFSLASEQFEAPIVFFFIGTIFENICFAIGITLKYRAIHHERLDKINTIKQLEYKQRLNTLKGIIQGEQKERKRIAEELHDGLGSLTATALLQLEYVGKKDESLAKNESFQKAMNIIEKVSDDVRSIAHNLMPKTLTKLGLVNAIKEYVESIHSPRITITETPGSFSITEQQSFILFRMIQECIQNTLKHAQAENMHISFSKDRNHLVITAKDDGIGFDDNNSKSDGIGLSNLKSRAELLNAKLAIESSPDNGTEIKISTPLLK